MAYDGTTPLQIEVAQIIGCSPKNQAKIAVVQKQAKQALGINLKTRTLSSKQRLQVYNHLVELYSQNDKKAL